jgi:hypothetical protein
VLVCTSPYSPPKTAGAPTVRVTKDSQSIVFDGKVVLTVHENHKGFPAGSSSSRAEAGWRSTTND